MTYNAYITGYLDGVCDHLAIEQTGGRPGSREVKAQSLYIRNVHQDIILPMWGLLDRVNTIQEVVEHLEYLGGDNLDEMMRAHLPRIAGYAIGASCAGYTLVVLGNIDNALDIRTAELWMARGVVNSNDPEDCDPSSEVRLSELVSEDGTYLQLRWITDEEAGDEWFVVRGPALPPTFVTPILDLQKIRNSFPMEHLC